VRQRYQQGSIGVFLIVLVGVAIMAGLWFFKPSPTLRLITESKPPIVDVIIANPSQYRATIISQGVVAPKRKINLVSEVSGRVVEVSANFEVGRFFKKDEPLLRLDDREYRHNLAIAEAQIVVAERELALEQGQARQAKRVWRDLGSEEANSLSLREPQLNAAKAGLRSAKAERDRALLNLERTAIKVPFDGRIQLKSVALGEFVSAGTNLATVYSDEAVEIRLPLNNQNLALAGLIPGKKIDSEHKGDTVAKILLSATIGDHLYNWPVTSMRMDADIDSATRFYSLITEVVDPFNTDKFEQPLLVGLFVQANISGKLYENIIHLPKKALIDDEHIFVVNSENKLSLRSVNIIDRQKNNMVVKSDIKVGEQIVISDTRVLKEDLTVEVNIIKETPTDKNKNIELNKIKLSNESQSDKN
jgi:RND family efflux transporter MFP subunit